MHVDNSADRPGSGHVAGSQEGGRKLAGRERWLGVCHGRAWGRHTAHPLWPLHDRLEIYRGAMATEPGQISTANEISHLVC